MVLLSLVRSFREHMVVESNWHQLLCDQKLIGVIIALTKCKFYVVTFSLCVSAGGFLGINPLKHRKKIQILTIKNYSKNRDGYGSG